jgi:hypothetical protein
MRACTNQEQNNTPFDYELATRTYANTIKSVEKEFKRNKNKRKQ